MAVSVGFIGVGNMGNPMAGNVLKAGFSMTVFDKSAKAMENLVQAGARAAASVDEVTQHAEMILTCLPMSPDVESLYLDAGGLIDKAKPGTILIDLSSVLPSTPRKLEPRAKARGLHFLEAPVSGGTSGARAATLAIMVGGDPQILEHWQRASSARDGALRGGYRVGKSVALAAELHLGLLRCKVANFGSRSCRACGLWMTWCRA